MRLVAGGPREKAYSVVGGQVRVSRFRSLDRDRIRTAISSRPGPRPSSRRPKTTTPASWSPRPSTRARCIRTLVQRELSPPGPGEVLVDVKAAGLNFRVSSPRPCASPVD
jgi:hypothetical protein